MGQRKRKFVTKDPSMPDLSTPVYCTCQKKMSVAVYKFAVKL